MTAPALGLQTPTWVIDGVTFPGTLTADARGREWVIHKDGETGWQGAPKSRTERIVRTNGGGAFRTAAYRDVRVLTLKGTVWCPDADTREDTELELAGLCSDPQRLYEYRRTTNRYDQVCLVELDDQVLLSNPAGMLRLDFSFQFAAPDPRKHAYVWQTPQTGVPLVQTGGFDFDPDGLDFDPEGIDTEDDTITGAATVVNLGTAPAYPVFQVEGPCERPVIYDRTTGGTLTFSGSLERGDMLTINTDSFTVMETPGHGVFLNTSNRRTQLVRRGEWPVVAPRSSSTFSFSAATPTDAKLTVNLRSAWH